MTPKEKAKNLFDYFLPCVYSTGSIELDYGYDKSVETDNAKECANKVVDELVNENNSILSMLRIHGDARNRLAIHIRIEYLMKVKQEI